MGQLRDELAARVAHGAPKPGLLQRILDRVLGEVKIEPAPPRVPTYHDLKAVTEPELATMSEDDRRRHFQEREEARQLGTDPTLPSEGQHR